MYAASFSPSSLYFSPSNSGSSLRISPDASPAFFRSSESWNTSPIRKSINPLCRIPKRSPGPRSFRSSFAIKNPSLDLFRISSRFFCLFLLRTTHKNTIGLVSATSYAPAELMKLRQPKRSAFSTMITVAFGTLIPTSITVVDTRTWISFFANAPMISSFSACFIRP